MNATADACRIHQPIRPLKMYFKALPPEQATEIEYDAQIKEVSCPEKQSEQSPRSVWMVVPQNRLAYK